MSSRFIDYWEDYEDNYTIPISDYLSDDDLILKGKYLFYNRDIKFSGKVKFNAPSGTSKFSTRADYSLQQKLYEESNYYFSHRNSGDITLDSYWLIGGSGRHMLQLYSKITATINEKERKGDIKFHLRNIFNNLIFSIGVENFDPFKCPHRDEPEKKHPMCLPSLSTWTLLGLRHNKQFMYGGFGLSYNLLNRALDNLRFLVSLNCKESNFKTHLEAIIKNPDVSNSKFADFKPVFKLYFDSNPINKVRILGSFEYDRQKPKDVKWNITQEVAIDKLTKSKIKINNNLQFTSTIMRRIGFINYALTCNINHRAPDGSLPRRLNYKFGALVEVIDV